MRASPTAATSALRVGVRDRAEERCRHSQRDKDDEPAPEPLLEFPTKRPRGQHQYSPSSGMAGKISIGRASLGGLKMNFVSSKLGEVIHFRNWAT